MDWSQFARDASSLAAARVSALFEFFAPRKASDARPVGRPRAASPGRESFFSRASRRRSPYSKLASRERFVSRVFSRASRRR